MSTVQALGIDPLNAQIRQVFFFDTPDLTLYQHGVVPRARRIQGKASDSVVKLRPVVPNELPKAIRKSPAFGVQVDVKRDGHVRFREQSGEGLAAHIRAWTETWTGMTLPPSPPTISSTPELPCTSMLGSRLVWVTTTRRTVSRCRPSPSTTASS